MSCEWDPLEWLISVYLFQRLLRYVAHAILNDFQNEICHINISCLMWASCKIITSELDMKSLILHFKQNNSLERGEKKATWTRRWNNINHTKAFPHSPSFPLVVYFTFWYILISSTVHQSFKLVVLKFLLVMCRRWNLEILLIFLEVDTVSSYKTNHLKKMTILGVCII